MKVLLLFIIFIFCFPEISESFHKSLHITHSRRSSERKLKGKSEDDSKRNDKKRLISPDELDSLFSSAISQKSAALPDDYDDDLADEPNEEVDEIDSGVELRGDNEIELDVNEKGDIQFRRVESSKMDNLKQSQRGSISGMDDTMAEFAKLEMQMRMGSQETVLAEISDNSEKRSVVPSSERSFSQLEQDTGIDGLDYIDMDKVHFYLSINAISVFIEC